MILPPGAASNPQFLRAYHEAGHAVARFFAGVKVASVTIHAPGDVITLIRGKQLDWRRELENFCPTSRRVARLHKQVMALMAGPVAEDRFAPCESRCRLSPDLENGLELLGRLHAPDVVPLVHKYLEAETRKFFARPMIWHVTVDGGDRREVDAMRVYLR